MNTPSTYTASSFKDEDDGIVEVFCSSADYTQSSAQCKNLGGSEVLDQANYASRRVSILYHIIYFLFGM